MRRWRLILELILHYTPMADSLHLCFPLGRSGRLPLAACRFFLPWSRFADDKIIFGNVSWQFGPSSFIFGHFFLLGVGLGLDMKWDGVAKFFDPTITPKNPRAYVTAGQVLSSVSAKTSSPAQGTLLALRYTRHTIINAFMKRRRSLRYTRRAFMKRCGPNGWGFPWKLGGTNFTCNSFFEFRANLVLLDFAFYIRHPGRIVLSHL